MFMDIVELIGGKYFRVRDVNELEVIYVILDIFEFIEGEICKMWLLIFLFYYFLVLVFILLLGWVLVYLFMGVLC